MCKNWTRRRTILAAISGMVAMNMSSAQKFPDRPISIILPYSPGGASDLLARIVAVSLGNELGQPVVVNNKPGAGGDIGTLAAASAHKDGYTLLSVTNAQIINPLISDSPKYDLLREFSPLAHVFDIPQVLVVPGSESSKSIEELIEKLKSQKDGVLFGSGGPGTLGHMVGQLFARNAGMDAVHVPYKGDGPGLTDLIGGRLHYYFTTLPAAAAYIEAKRLRALGISGSKRDPAFPKVPTFSELDIFNDFDPTLFVGYMVPKGTSESLCETLATAILQVSSQPELRRQLGSLGASVENMGGPRVLFNRIEREKTIWSELLKAGVQG
ncbi:Bug family tripartite tricarboxylate transporter substrate binding protein [Advenella mimigardefordensis]|uniref:Putative Bug-like extracytoplasmic solute binding receptor, TTT family n=1 Tax=Advenella mimigardefordensis (strain DSM 17166 / LMG 22922 / DPN7) TaxID=1247726 RepID=W0PFQ3_ADVMD|nr:tripartite tricarboxylate transporter substrate binding protein [Advenella mimigardefordensis]AHG64120.1 putative Bug-like extracytoplasmic solute binding receptor, TTT family [Advenella mimigardefordensis DPN7]